MGIAALNPSYGLFLNQRGHKSVLTLHRLKRYTS